MSMMKANFAGAAAAVLTLCAAGMPSLAQDTAEPPVHMAQAKAPPRPSASTAAANSFKLKVCNKHRDKISLFVAVLYSKDANTWQSKGWITVDAGECTESSDAYPRQNTFWYAESACCPVKVTYPGKDAFGCTNPKDDFERSITGDYQCSDDEQVNGFKRVSEDIIKNGLTLD
jgi:uncharacterized membrane protein